MQEGGSVVEHLNNFNTILNQFSAVGLNIEDEMLALIFLASLPNSWENMRTVISNSMGNSKLKFQDVHDQIIAEEIRRKDSSEYSNSGSALNTENRGRSSERGSGRARGQSKNKRSKSKDGRIAFWNCGKIGHLKRDCKAPKTNQDNKTNDVANIVARDVSDEDALVLSVDDTCDSWVLDSGASFHTTGHRGLLENYVAKN